MKHLNKHTKEIIICAQEFEHDDDDEDQKIGPLIDSFTISQPLTNSLSKNIFKLQVNRKLVGIALDNIMVGVYYFKTQVYQKI